MGKFDKYLSQYAPTLGFLSLNNFMIEIKIL